MRWVLGEDFQQNGNVSFERHAPKLIMKFLWKYESKYIITQKYISGFLEFK